MGGFHKFGKKQMTAVYMDLDRNLSYFDFVEFHSGNAGSHLRESRITA